MYLIGDLIKLGHLSVHCITGIFSGVKTCIFIPKHRLLVCFGPFQDLLSFLRKLLLNSNIESYYTPNMIWNNWGHIFGCKVIYFSNRRSYFEVTEKLVDYSPCTSNFRIFNENYPLPVYLSPRFLPARKMEIFFSGTLDIGTTEVFSNPYTVNKVVSGLSGFLEWYFGKCEAYGNYDGSLVYMCLSRNHKTMKNFWYTFVGVAVYYFYKLAMKLNYKATDRN